MAKAITQAELEAYVDEALSIEETARIEASLRGDQKLTERLAAIHARRDAGIHSLGEIWRRHRASCPSREQLGSYLLGVLADEESEFVRCHLDAVGCRVCAANVHDLKSRQSDEPAHTERRRKKYFESSAGHLRH